MIYGLVDPRNGQLRYVGKSTIGIARPRQHRRPYRLKTDYTWKANWIRKLLELGLDYNIVIIQEFDGAEILDKAEIFWIAYFRKMGFILTNLTNGGEGTLGTKQSQETKDKKSAKLRGRKCSPETVERMRLASLGKSPSEETRKKIGDAHRGKKASEETKARMGAARRGRHHTKDAKRKISLAHGAQPFIDQNGVRYEGLSEAADVLCLDPSSILKVLKGIYGSTKGFVFRYLDDPRPFPGVVESGLCPAVPIVDQNGISYASASEAARKLSLWRQNIRLVLRGKIKSTGGYSFRYLDGPK